MKTKRNHPRMSLAYPCVTLLCRDRQAQWYGKWHLNWSVENVRAIGGPWDTEAEAVQAVLATGLYTLRPNMASPHMDRI